MTTRIQTLTFATLLIASAVARADWRAVHRTLHEPINLSSQRNYRHGSRSMHDLFVSPGAASGRAEAHSLSVGECASEQVVSQCPYFVERWVHYPPLIGEVEVTAFAAAEATAERTHARTSSAAAWGFGLAEYEIDGLHTPVLATASSAVSPQANGPSLPTLRAIERIGRHNQTAIDVDWGRASITRQVDQDQGSSWDVVCPAVYFNAATSTGGGLHADATRTLRGLVPSTLGEIGTTALVTYALLEHQVCPPNPR